MSTNGKGDRQRPAQIPPEQLAERWARTFTPRPMGRFGSPLEWRRCGVCEHQYIGRISCPKCYPAKPKPESKGA